jgi:hypothetical protein
VSTYQALLAVALIRLGESDIALSTVDEVARDVKGAGKALADANMLSLCAAVYEQCPGHSTSRHLYESIPHLVLLQCADLLVIFFCPVLFAEPQALAMWENASRLHPNNIDLAYGAHSYFVRIGAYRAAEEVSRAKYLGRYWRKTSAFVTICDTDRLPYYSHRRLAGR